MQNGFECDDMNEMRIGGSGLRTAVMMLERHLVAKPWGRECAGDWGCGAHFEGRVGEIHHRLPKVLDSRASLDVPGADALLLKTLFTDEMLSVQVHPDAATARAMGMPRGKDEAWLVLDAEPGAQIGLGLRCDMSEAEFAAAVADGSVVDAMLWQEVKPRDVLLAPAGTVHAIGAGVTVLEVQENNDLTWRLFDHGRGRMLDVVNGLKVARREAYVAPGPFAPPEPGRRVMAAGGGFVLECVHGQGMLTPEPGRPVWAAAVSEGTTLGGMPLARGAVALVLDAVPVQAGEALMLAKAGPTPQPMLWVPA